MSDAAALLLRILDPRQACKEAIGGVDAVDRKTEGRKAGLHLVALVEAQQAGVHEDGRRALPHRLPTQQGGDRRVHAAGERHDDPSVRHLLLNPLDGVTPDRGRSPVPARPTDGEEVLQDSAAHLGVADLGVELDPVESSGLVGHRGNRRVRGVAYHGEAVGQPDHAVPVRHPYPLRCLGPGEQRTREVGLELCGAILAAAGRLDLTTEQVRHRLLAVAEAQYRRAEPEHARVRPDRTVLIDRGRASGKDDPDRAQRLRVARRDVAAPDFAEDAQLAHAPRDELGVLAAEVQNEQGLVGHTRAATRPAPCYQPQPSPATARRRSPTAHLTGLNSPSPSAKRPRAPGARRRSACARRAQPAARRRPGP